MVVREGLLGAKRLAPPRSPPERPAALNLAYGQVVEPDFWSVEGSSINRMAMDAEMKYLARTQLVVREGLEPATSPSVISNLLKFITHLSPQIPLSPHI